MVNHYRRLDRMRNKIFNFSWIRQLITWYTNLLLHTTILQSIFQSRSRKSFTNKENNKTRSLKPRYHGVFRVSSPPCYKIPYRPSFQPFQATRFSLSPSLGRPSLKYEICLDWHKTEYNFFKKNNKMLSSSKRKNNRRSGVFIVNSEYISHLVLVFVLLTLIRQLNGSWQILE